MTKTVRYTLVLALMAVAAWAANSKISDEANGTPAQLSDQLRIARAGDNKRLNVDDLNGEHCTKTLVESTNTSVVQVSVASGASTGGRLHFVASASDGTDHQTLSGSLYFAAVNKAGTETCSDPTIVGTALNSNSAGTLTCTYACDETPANAVNLQLNCTSSLTQSVFQALAHVELVGGGTPSCP